MTRKGFDGVTAHADIHPDQYRFKRQHTGDLVPGRGLCPPLWPMVPAAVIMLLIGCHLIVRAPNAGVALGGLIFCLMGVAVIGGFTWLLGREYE